MADISFTRKFSHTDWVDGESIVQASTSNGFNARFHGIETDLDAVSTTFGEVNTALQSIQRLQFLVSEPTTTLAPATASAEIPVEIYDRAAMDANLDKAYFCIIYPITGINVVHTFLYRQVPVNKTKVTIAFYNPTGSQVSFGFRILALATVTS